MAKTAEMAMVATFIAIIMDEEAGSGMLTIEGILGAEANTYPTSTYGADCQFVSN